MQPICEIRGFYCCKLSAAYQHFSDRSKNFIASAGMVIEPSCDGSYCATCQFGDPQALMGLLPGIQVFAPSSLPHPRPLAGKSAASHIYRGL